MKRGEIWLAELSEPIGRRPVVLLSRNAAYRIKSSVTVATITRTIRHIPVEVQLSEEDGMRTRCVINLDDIITVAKSKLIRLITTLSESKMDKVNRAIVYALDLRL